MYYYTDIYFDNSCEGGGGGGGVFIFRLIAWGIVKICMDLGGISKNEPLKKKSFAPPPPSPPVAYIMNAALRRRLSINLSLS